MGTYLVTGAAGFIGAKVAEMLLDGGHRVVGIDNLNDAYDVRLKHWRLDQIKDHDGFTFHQSDICDPEGLEQATFGRVRFDAVLNLAARSGVRQSVENPWVYQETNVTGVLNLLELCRAYAVTKFVQASTSSLYGNSCVLPYDEDQPTDHPISPYAASKKGAEALCYTYHYLYGLDVTVFRYFTVYGPAGRPDMSLFRFVQWISEERPVLVFGDGTQSRDFIYIDDIARGTIAGLKPLGYEIINLGSDTPIMLLDTIRIVERAVGKDARLEFQPWHKADVLATWASIGKADRLLGWRPQQDFEGGLHCLTEWYQRNRAWAREIETESIKNQGALRS